jgi:hypothetical protein
MSTESKGPFHVGEDVDLAADTNAAGVGVAFEIHAERADKSLALIDTRNAKSVADPSNTTTGFTATATWKVHLKLPDGTPAPLVNDATTGLSGNANTTGPLSTNLEVDAFTAGGGTKFNRILTVEGDGVLSNAAWLEDPSKAPLTNDAVVAGTKLLLRVEVANRKKGPLLGDFTVRFEFLIVDAAGKVLSTPKTLTQAITAPAAGNTELVAKWTSDAFNNQSGATRVRLRVGFVRRPFEGFDHADAAPILSPIVTVLPPIAVANPVVLVKKPGCTPRRVQVTLRAGNGFTGTGTLTRSDPRIDFFTAAAGGAPIAFDGVANVFAGAALSVPGGVTLFAEGVTASGALNDTTLTHTLTGGVGPQQVGTATMTAVALTVDVCQSRTAAAGDPALMTAADKISRGRFVHLQDPGRHQGRVMIVVRRAAPAAFTGDLVLTALAAGAGRVSLLAGETPPVPPAAADAPLAAPFVVTNASLAAAPNVLGSPGLRFFVEGTTVSGALRDTGLQLGLQGGDPDGDRALVTVVRFSNLEAEVRSTQAQTARVGNSPVPNSILRRGTGAALAAADFDEDFAVNAPLVLVEDSLPAANPVQLRVRVQPAQVPVAWSVLRDTRPGAAGGDNAQIIALKAAPHLPAITPVGPTSVAAAATPIRATLASDAVGSFRVRAFVDENGSGTFDRDPATATSFAAEPFILMNLVLVRVEGVSNTSAGTSTLNPAGPGTVGPGSVTPGAGAAPITSATGVAVSTGGFVAATAACRNTAQVKVIGGGADGRRGLNPARVFGGWINNELDAATGTRPNPSGEDVVSEYFDTTPAPPAPPLTHTRISVWVIGGGTFGPAAAPVLVPGPVLDCTNFANNGSGGNLCVGTEGAVGPPGGITKTVVAAAAANPGGELWTINMFDSPGDTCPAAHGALPGTLSSYRFNIDFRSDLCFWTNIRGLPGPTPGPVTTAASPAPDSACCLYSSVQTNRWNIRFAMAFNPATGAVVGAIPTITINHTRDPAPTRRARPVAPVEVRFPVSLNLLGIHRRA